MQPDHKPTDWQQPNEQSAQPPYIAPTSEEPRRAPVVTLTSDDSTQPDTVFAEEAAPVLSIPEQPSSEAINEPQVELEPVHWQAHEYIHHEKSLLWFTFFTIIAIGLIAAAVFVMQSITFAILVPVMAAALLVYTHRPPRLLDYTLSGQGLHINDHLYSFSEFKAFGVIRDGEEYSIMLLPVKRFMPSVSVYFPEEAGEAIVDMLGARLPMQELHLDFVDRIIRKLRI